MYHFEPLGFSQEDLSSVLPKLSPGHSFLSRFSDQTACWVTFPRPRDRVGDAGLNASLRAYL